MELAFVTVSLTELIYLPGGIDNLLLAREKWMALRAYIDAHRIISISRTGYERVSTATGYVNLLVIWMYICFHDLIIQ